MFSYFLCIIKYESNIKKKNEREYDKYEEKIL